MPAEVRYYKLSVEDLPREEVLRWCKDLGPNRPHGISVDSARSGVYCLAIEREEVRRSFDAWLKRKGVQAEITTTPPPEWKGYVPRGSSSGGGSRGGEGFLDTVFDGIGDVFDALFDWS